MVRTRSSQSLSTSAWLGRRRKGNSCTSAILFSSGSCCNSSPSLSRFPASMYQARSRRSLPTESIVPPVSINATLGKLAMKDPSLCAILCHEQISVSYLRASTSSSRSKPESGQRVGLAVGIPCNGHYVDRMTGEKRRHHLHESVLQR